MPADLTPNPPRTVDGYLRLMARAIFSAGLSWAMVDARWPALQAAFDGFSAKRVAAYGKSDLDRILRAPGVVHNRGKAAAVVAAAGLLSEQRDRHGSVTAWLESLGTFEERARRLRRVPYLGPFGAFYVLSVAGFEVPEDWRGQAKGDPGGPLRTTALHTVS